MNRPTVSTSSGETARTARRTSQIQNTTIPLAPRDVGPPTPRSTSHRSEVAPPSRSELLPTSSSALLCPYQNDVLRPLQFLPAPPQYRMEQYASSLNQIIRSPQGN